MTRNVLASTIALAGALAVGCGGEQPGKTGSGHTKKTIKLDEVPKEIMDVAKKEMPTVEISEAFKKVDRKTDAFVSYELRGKDAKTGKIHEVGVAKDGKVVDRE